MEKSVPLHSKITNIREMDTIIKKLALLLFVCLCLTAQGQENIVDRLNKTLGVRLPAEYEVMVKTFVDTNKVMKDRGTAAFTEQFIAKEMETDWNIDKQNQLLFIWHYIYKQVTDKDLYIGNGGNPQLENDFNNRGINIRIRAGGQKYRSACIAYMNQRSEEAKQRSEEAIKEIMKQDTIWVKERMVEFYNLYNMNPNKIKKEDLDFMMNSTQRFITQCKEYNIDYYAILLKEVGDEKKVEAILKFYGVE